MTIGTWRRRIRSTHAPGGKQRPRSATERRVAQIASELLHGRPVGREDDFFAVGGHSLLAARLVARVNDAFDVHVPVARFLQRPTVADLAAAVTAATTGPKPGPGPGPLAPASRRTAARLLAEIDRLSDEEVESLLRDMEATEEE